MSDELRPCPFCGKDEVHICNASENYTYVSCYGNDGDCCDGPGAKTEAEAIEAWNTRPVEDGLRTELEQARQLCQEEQAENERLRERVAVLEHQLKAARNALKGGQNG